MCSVLSKSAFLTNTTARPLPYTFCRRPCFQVLLKTPAVCSMSRPEPRSKDDMARPTSTRHSVLDFGFDPLAVQEPALEPRERQRLDDSNDSIFYTQPCFVAHTDDEFRRQLTDLYTRLLLSNMRILDLCSSVRSHLPADLTDLQVTGIGMNVEELAANPQLSEYFVQDLNKIVKIQADDGSFDAVLCSNGIQYLQLPEWVLLEVLRVLKPGGMVSISFSCHCYKEKAISGWLERDSAARINLVQRLLQAAGFSNIQVITSEAADGLQETTQVASSSTITASSSAANVAPASAQLPNGSTLDPLYAVLGFKPTAPANAVFEMGAATLDPAKVADAYVGPALREITELPVPGDVSPRTLERWADAYHSLVAEARSLGIPKEAIPSLPEPLSARSIREARDYLRDMIASFMSAGL